MSDSSVQVHKLDILDAVLCCQSAMAQDAPQPPAFYLNQVNNLLYGYIDAEQRREVEDFLAEKKYLPHKQIILDEKKVVVPDAKIVVSDT